MADRQRKKNSSSCNILRFGLCSRVGSMKLVNEMQIDIGLQSMFKIIPLDSVIELSSMVEEERVRPN